MARYSGCKEYVLNDAGVFFGNEDRVFAIAERDRKMSSNQLGRLDVLPDIRNCRVEIGIR